ncbi:hypothetical protein Pelo_4196 [Pelomyxa schiedti]|nr:hypothetical protein Pelo_4196 [Pelomyxa schiedti]
MCSHPHAIFTARSTLNNTILYYNSSHGRTPQQLHDVPTNDAWDTQLGHDRPFPAPQVQNEMAMMLNAQRAREQVLALVMASHNRCGASSPARHFVRALPDLATSPLWDWCLGPDSEVVFGLLVSTPEFHSSHCYYTFGVSSTLMSVTRDIRSVGGRSLWKGKQTAPSHLTLAVDPGHLVVTQFTGYGRTGWAFSLLDVVTQEHRLLLSERVTQSSPRVYANRKWFLRYQIEGSLGIVNLLPLLQQQQQHKHVEVSDILQCNKVFRGEVITFWGISISNYVPDEAVVLYSVGFARDLFLLLVDVSKTHSTGNLSVLSLTKVLLHSCPDTCYGISSCLLMKKANGARVFICPFLGVRRYTVFEVAERVGTFKLVSSNNVEGLSQLSNSLFCTLKADYHNIEIWDCNNIVTCSDRDGEATPLRVISLSPVEPDALLFVEGESGFLFHKHGTMLSWLSSSVDLTDSTGLHICTITFPSKPQNITVTSS